MRLALFACAVSVLAACSSPSGPAVSYSNVAISDAGFAPGTVTIVAGAGVRWTNSGALGHTITADGGAFGSGTLGAPGSDGYGGMTSGGSFRWVFAAAGTFPYHCSIHTGMTGAVVVTP